MATVTASNSCPGDLSAAPGESTVDGVLLFTNWLCPQRGCGPAFGRTHLALGEASSRPRGLGGCTAQSECPRRLTSDRHGLGGDIAAEYRAAPVFGAIAHWHWTPKQGLKLAAEVPCILSPHAFAPLNLPNTGHAVVCQDAATSPRQWMNFWPTFEAKDMARRADAALKANSPGAHSQALSDLLVRVSGRHLIENYDLCTTPIVMKNPPESVAHLDFVAGIPTLDLSHFTHGTPSNATLL